MKKILVPFDFSAEALNALRSALGFGSNDNAEILVLHVIELPIVHDSVLLPVMTFEQSLLEDLKEKAQKTFERVYAGFAASKVEVKLNISFGPISRVILSYIKNENIDLVIMGTKGSSGIHEILIGSNTEKIVRASPAPVLVLREPLKTGDIRNIVFPTNVDFEQMDPLIQRVKALQHSCKATLHLVWINTPGNFSNDERSLSRLNEFAKRYMLVDYKVNVFNDAHEEAGIIRFCHYIGADLLVMATHGRKGLAHVFRGSLTEDVVNHIDLPVWTFSARTHEPSIAN
jgi:nucleotide-binding universal stress UspA family protein